MKQRMTKAKRLFFIAMLLGWAFCASLYKNRLPAPSEAGSNMFSHAHHEKPAPTLSEKNK
jgi:hypothetical protein